MNSNLSVQNLILVFVGGGFGCIVRYLMSVFCFSKCLGLPWHTLLANIVGCAFIGVLFGLFLAKQNFLPEVKLFLMVGFCGGLTTFSTFSLELFNLFQQSKYLAIGYAFLSVVGCFISVLIGFWFCGVLLKNGL